MAVTMKANRIHVFGGPEVILFEDVARPTPGTGEILVGVHAAGFGPWDARVFRGEHEGRSFLFALEAAAAPAARRRGSDGCWACPA